MRQLPWLTAPRAALSSPLTMIVAAVTALLSCFLGAAAVLHSSASGSAAVDYQAEQVCPDSHGPVFDAVNIPVAQVDATTEAISRRAAEYGFGTPKVAMYTGNLDAVEFGGQDYKVRLGYTDGGIDNLNQLQGTRAPGLWMGDHLAVWQGIPLGTRGLHGALPPVTGIHADLTSPAPRWWCGQQQLAVQQRLVDPSSGAVIFATDRDTWRKVMDVTSARLERLTVTFPGPAPHTIDEAHDRNERADALIAAINSDLGGRGPGAAPLSASTPFARSVDIAERAENNVALSILPLAAISVLIGCAGVGTVGLQWFQRRYPQLRLLAARGSAPAALGGLAVAELGIALITGGIAGAVVARLSLPLYGPPGEVSPAAQTAAGLVSFGIVLLSLLLLAAVVAVRSHREFQLARVRARRRSARWLRLAPWELLTAAAAVVGWSELLSYGGSSRSLNPLPQVNPVALTYPVFVVLTVGLVAARVTWLLLHLSHRASFWSRPSLQLAIRRLAGARAPVVGVLVIGVLAIGTLAAGNGIATAQAQALETKSSIFVGAESRVDTESPVGRGEQALPEPLRDNSSVIGELTGTGAVVLVVDADTFTRVARLGAVDTGTDTAGLIDELRAPTANAELPALRVGKKHPSTTALPAGLPDVRPVADLPVFPILGNQPGYVISRSALTPEQLAAVPKWSILSSAPLTEVAAALAAVGLSQPNAVSRETALDALPFSVVEWTFSFVVVLGAVLAAVAVLALMVAVEVRRRQNMLSGAFALRMGLRPRALFGSHLIELGALAGLAVLTGMVCGLTVAGMSVPRFDPARWLAPRSELPDLVAFTVTVVGGGILVVLAAGWIAVRSVRTAGTAELLRG